MDKNQSELTDKIRSAIKKKLVEINAFVDNELPDYIMILVANKRSKTHMEKDLALFLGKDTTDFTNWLWDLVNNLKSNSKPKQATKVSKKEDNTKKKDVASDEDADVLDYDLGEPEGDLYQDDETSLQSRPLPVEFPLTSKFTNSSSVIQQPAPKESSTSKFMDYRKLSSKGEVYPIQTILRVHPCSKVVPLEKKRSLEDQYDPAKPEFTGNVSSVVRVTQRNSVRPAALQPNKLLLRAVDDATKSVLDGKSINDYYKPTPITELSTSKVEKSSSRAHNLVNVKIDSRFDLKSAENICHEEPSVLSENSNDSNVNFLENVNSILSENSQNIRTILPSVMDEDVHNVSVDSSNTSQLSPSYVKEDTQISPHFIVTLDGVDSSTFKRRHVESSDESMEIDEDGIFLADDGSNTAKKQKITERCKYWPACKNSDNCAYHHPTVPCKCFPECKYGDKCLYIHPNCKFDALCSRKDCPFTHASRRKFYPKPVPVKIRSTKTICKFYPKCTVWNCAFIHPKLCRYGTKCRSPICSYSHFNIPARNQMTWKAEVS